VDESTCGNERSGEHRKERKACDFGDERERERERERRSVSSLGWVALGSFLFRFCTQIRFQESANGTKGRAGATRFHGIGRFVQFNDAAIGRADFADSSR
jgi:hypothetical protein